MAVLSSMARQGLSRECTRLVFQYMTRVHDMSQPDFVSSNANLRVNRSTLLLVYIVTAVAHATACQALHRASETSPLAPVILRGDSLLLLGRSALPACPPLSFGRALHSIMKPLVCSIATLTGMSLAFSRRCLPEQFRAETASLPCCDHLQAYVRTHAQKGFILACLACSLPSDRGHSRHTKETHCQVDGQHMVGKAAAGPLQISALRNAAAH